MKRRLSWVLGGLAYIAPPTWAYFEQASLYEELAERHGYVCGLPMLAIAILAGSGACVLSGLASWCGYMSFQALPRPRPRIRSIELAVLATPCLVSASYVTSLFIA